MQAMEALLRRQDAAGGAEMVLHAALGMEAARRDLTTLLDGPLGDSPAAGALRQRLLTFTAGSRRVS
jgi:hypothetical protein